MQVRSTIIVASDEVSTCGDMLSEGMQRILVQIALTKSTTFTR